MLEVNQNEPLLTARLARTIRANDGKVHRQGESVTLIREMDKLGRPMWLVVFNDATRGYVFPEELEQ